MIHLKQSYRVFIVFFLVVTIHIMSSNALTGTNINHSPEPIVLPQEVVVAATTTSTTAAGAMAKKTCLPCESMNRSSRLKNVEVLEKAKTLPLWTVVRQKSDVEKDDANDATDDDDNTQSSWMLSRVFVAKNFQTAVDALNIMGNIAERENHHFDFHLTNYRHVQINIYTHSVQGLTENDFILASMLDTEVNFEYSPKWLKEHPILSTTQNE